MKQVYRARDAAEAHFVRGAIEAAGVRAVVQGETLGSIAGELPFFLATPTVWVNDEDVGDAMSVLADLQQPKSPADPIGEAWRCETCGETIEPQFDGCWRCAQQAEEANCSDCGYPLRGLPAAGDCPECGEPYDRSAEDVDSR